MTTLIPFSIVYPNPHPSILLNVCPNFFTIKINALMLHYYMSMERSLSNVPIFLLAEFVFISFYYSALKNKLKCFVFVNLESYFSKKYKLDVWYCELEVYINVQDGMVVYEIGLYYAYIRDIQREIQLQYIDVLGYTLRCFFFCKKKSFTFFYAF